MTMIPTVQDSVEPRGEIQIMRRGQANESDFGAQIGHAGQAFAGALGQAGDALNEYAQQQDVTNVYKNMAQARADWTQNLQDRAAQAQPGDDTFAPTIMKDMGDYFDKGAASATTSKGQALWAQMSANMASEFGMKAIGVQAELTGQAAVQDNAWMVKSAGTAVQKDPTQLAPALDQVKSAIYDTDGMYSKIPGPQRDKLWEHAQAALVDYAATGGTIAHPDRALTEQVKAEFRPFEDVINKGAIPGGRVDLSPATTAKLSEIVPAAAAAGVDPGIAAAVIDQKATTPQDPAALSASLATLLNTYGGDYTKALAAYHDGVKAVDTAMSFFGTDWQNHITGEGQAFVQDTMQKAGMTAAQPVEPGMEPPVPEAPGPRQPVSNPNIPGWDDLPAERQVQLSQMAAGLMANRLHMAQAQTQEAARLKAEASEATLKDAYVKVLTHGFGNGDLEALEKDPNISAQQLDWIVKSKIAVARQGQEEPEHPALVSQLVRTMAQSNGVYDISPAREALAHGQITATEFQRVDSIMGALKNSDTSNLTRRMLQQEDTAEGVIKNSTQGSIEKSKADIAAQSYKLALESALNGAKAAGKDPFALLDEWRKPEKIMSFMDAANVTMAGAAKKQIPVVKTDADFAAVQPGTQFMDLKGNIKTKPAGMAKAPAAASTPQADGVWVKDPTGEVQKWGWGKAAQYGLSPKDVNDPETVYSLGQGTTGKAELLGTTERRGDPAKRAAVAAAVASQNRTNANKFGDR